MLLNLESVVNMNNEAKPTWLHAHSAWLKSYRHGRGVPGLACDGGCLQAGRGAVRRTWPVFRPFLGSFSARRYSGRQERQQPRLAGLPGTLAQCVLSRRRATVPLRPHRRASPQGLFAGAPSASAWIARPVRTGSVHAVSCSVNHFFCEKQGINFYYRYNTNPTNCRIKTVDLDGIKWQSPQMVLKGLSLAPDRRQLELPGQPSWRSRVPEKALYPHPHSPRL